MEELRKEVIENVSSGRIAIKPCPFCGGKAELMSKAFYEELVEDNGRALISIGCKVCNAEIKDFPSDHDDGENDYYIRAFYVISAWNKRAGEQNVSM